MPYSLTVTCVAPLVANSIPSPTLLASLHVASTRASGYTASLPPSTRRAHSHSHNTRDSFSPTVHIPLPFSHYLTSRRPPATACRTSHAIFTLSHRRTIAHRQANLPATLLSLSPSDSCRASGPCHPPGVASTHYHTDPFPDHCHVSHFRDQPTPDKNESTIADITVFTHCHLCICGINPCHLARP